MRNDQKRSLLGRLQDSKISGDDTGRKAAVLVRSKKLALVANSRGIQNRSSGRACVCTGGRRDLEAISMFVEFISHRRLWFGLHWAGKSKGAWKSSTWTSNLFRKFCGRIGDVRLLNPASKAAVKEPQRERRMSGKKGCFSTEPGQGPRGCGQTELAHRPLQEKKYLWLKICAP